MASPVPPADSARAAISHSGGGRPLPDVRASLLEQSRSVRDVGSREPGSHPSLRDGAPMSRVDPAPMHDSNPDVPHEFTECDCGSRAYAIEHCYLCGEARDDGQH